MATLKERQQLTGSRRIKYVQDRIKAICKEFKIPEINPGPSDGEHGPRTDFAIGRMKRCFGATQRHRNAKTTDSFIAHLYHPFDRGNFKKSGQWERGLAYREALRRLHTKRLKAKAKALKAAGGSGGGARATAWLSAKHGWTEQPPGSNDSTWLANWRRKLNMGWMRGQPYCGFALQAAYLYAAAKRLPADTPSTIAIANRARSGNGFTHVGLNSIKVGDLVVFNFGSGGPKHVGLARGPMRGGVIPTIEANTSSGNGGSQSNGGGIYRRTRPAGLVHTVARPR